MTGSPTPTPDRRAWDAERLVGIDERWQVEVRRSVGSTNAECARTPVPGRVVVAEEQSAGRGRLGRSWTTTPFTSVAVSAVVADPQGPIEPYAASPVPLRGWVPLVAGLALRRALAEAAGLSGPAAAALKWPNDVLAGVGPEQDRKLAGILCEWTPGGIVVGAGINVSSTRDELPLDTATSVLLAGGRADRETLLVAYLGHLGRLLDELSADPGRVRAAYRDACTTLGRDVVLHRGGEPDVRGRAVDVDEAGRLVLDTSEGPWTAFAGDVVHLRPATAGGPP